MSNDPVSNDPARYLTQAECEALFHRVTQLASGGDTTVTITGLWRGTTRWVRNAVITSTDFTDTTVVITRIVRGARGTATTNQTDDLSLRLAVGAADAEVRRVGEDPDQEFLSGPRSHPIPALFHKSTYGLLAADRAKIAQTLIPPAIAAGVSAAGYLEARANTLGVYDTRGLASYYATTSAQYASTVRDPARHGIGWAGGDHSDWTRLDALALAQHSLDKCLRARDPVMIEPGRYVVVLEPQATHELVKMALLQTAMIRLDNEKFDFMPYNLRRAPRGKLGAAKFGLQLIDERVTIGTDPMDPDGGYLPFTPEGVPYRKVAWFDQGILRELAYGPDYALSVLDSPTATPYTPAYRMTGGETSIAEMIRNTERGVLVTRFNKVALVDRRSLIITGVTSGGTWLIEHGAVTRPVVNLRFTTSPLFVLNNIQQLGPPQRVFSPDAPAIVPPLKVREFNFTSLSEVV
jgi:predicted Zn-dependent protease